MFSSVFDKIVSATAPDALGTFPPRGDLPASSSTLCCLSFVDQFIAQYPTAQTASIDDDADGRLLLGRPGIAMSANDLEVIMESAAELGGRLAAALAGTVRSKRRELATAPVSDLLGKVRGIFGNRLACVGREIRVSRDAAAEGDETLLLRQIHAIKNAALSVYDAEKWCLIVSSGGESLAVCSVPLPAVEEGGANGCDFLVFDPWPRPAMKLRGSYIVKFTTVRGLQLHLLSALGEIWREGGLPQKEATKKEFVGLSVVMKTARGAEDQVDLNARRQLEDSVTSLRKAEKAAAIKIKRDEIETLRKALEKSARDKPRASASPISGGMFRLTHDATEFRQTAKDSDLSTEPADPLRTSTQSHRQQELPRRCREGSTFHSEVSAAKDKDIPATKSNGVAVSNHTTDGSENMAVERAASQTNPGETKMQPKRTVSNSCNRPRVRAQLRPPVLDVSPPLSVRRYERADEPRCWPDENGDPAVFGRWRSQAQGVMTGAKARTNVENSTPGRRESAGIETLRELRTSSVTRDDLGTGCADVDDNIYSPSHRPESAVLDDPLHRALLRSIEGEELAEYSKRAYHLYRTNGVIEGGAGLDKHEGTTSDPLSSSANQLFEGASLFTPAVHVNVIAAPAISSQETNEGKIGGEDEAHIHRVRRKEYGPVGVGICEPIRPFSPPAMSPQALLPDPGICFPDDDGTAFAVGPASTSDNDLRVVDLCEAEEPVVQESVVPALRLDRCRSRLRAPRAGRTLALASANAHGVAVRCEEERPLGPCRDAPESELSSAKTAGGLTRRKEAWTKEGMVKQQQSDRTQPNTEVSGARTSSGVVEIRSDDDEDGVLDRSAAASKNMVPPREDNGRKIRPSHQQKKGKELRKRREHRLVGLPVQGYHGDGRKNSRDEARIASEEGHRYEGKAWIGPSQNEPGPIDECITIATSASNHSPQQFIIPTKSNIHHAKGNDTHSHVPSFEGGSGGACSTQVYVAKPSSLETDVAGLNRGETSETKSLESLGKPAFVAKDESHDGHAFVWFGQPDTPPDRQPDQGVEVKGGATFFEATVTATGGQRVGRVVSPRRQQRSKARLILQMEVRRQRDIIEQAFQAREEEGRIRRARIGAEVFKRMQGLRLRRTLSTQNGKPACTDSCLVRQPSLERPDLEHVQEPHPPLSRQANTSMPSPPQARKGGKERPPSGIDEGVEATVKAVQPQQLLLDLTAREEAVAPRPDQSIERPRAPCVVAVADNPWLQVVTMQKVEHESGIPTNRAPTPPPVSFNVEANASREGAGGLEEVERLEREKARRQERYEALRARKMAEEKERRRGQKERQIAAREEQRRQTAAATVAATAAAAAADAVSATADEQDGSQNVKNDVRFRHLLQPDSIGVEMSSLQNTGHSTPSARAPSSSVPGHDHNYAKYGVSTHGESNRSGGSGGARPPAALAGRLASPVIRGFSRRSNRKLVRNALNFLCLAGGHLEEKKARALEALDSHLASNFVVLLAHTKLLSFKGLYACSGEEDGIALRVFGLGPPQVDASMASGFYKYNSAAREFREVHSKTLGKTTDAISMEPTRIKRPKGLATQ